MAALLRVVQLHLRLQHHYLSAVNAFGVAAYTPTNRQSFSVRGRLTDVDGQPITAATNVTFNLYSVASV